MRKRDDNQTNDEALKGSAPGSEIDNIRRRAFIQRLAKAGTIAPAAVLLYSASANAYAVGD